MDNKVTGSRMQDNKDPKNKEKVTHGQTQMGSISGHQKATYYRPPNSPESTPKQQNPNMGDKGVQMQAKRQKKIIRQSPSYTDRAIAYAKQSRGM